MNKELSIENKTYWLVHASPEFVYEWLENNSISRKDWFPNEDPCPESLEFALLKRNDPIINLALALYTYKPNTARVLYETCDETIQKAALSSGGIGSTSLLGSGNWANNFEFVKKLIEGEKKELLAILLQNKRVESEILMALFERSNTFSDINNDLWFSCLDAASKNSRLQLPPEEDPYDGYSWYLDSKVPSLAWTLFATVPVTDQNANFMWDFGQRLCPEIHSDMDVEKTLSRWNVQADNEFHLMAYKGVRKTLTKLCSSIPDDWKDSEDEALREVYYKNCWKYSPDMVRRYFEKDGDIFIESAMENIRIFKDSDSLSELKKCIQLAEENSHKQYWLDDRVKHFQERFHESFREPTKLERFRKLEDPLERLEAKLDHFYENAELTPSHSDEAKISYRKLVNELREQLDLLQFGINSFKLSSIRMNLLFLVSGAAIGYLFG